MTQLAQPVAGLDGLSLSITALLVFTGTIYWYGWQRIRAERSKDLPAWRAGVFTIGMLIVWLAAASPIAMLDHEFLTVHMLQHTLLMSVAAPLLLLGEPELCLRHASPSVLRRSDRLFGDFFLQWLRRLVTHPATCFLAGTLVLIFWHIPDVFEVAMKSITWHAVEMGTFLAAGILFWSPITRLCSTDPARPRWWMPLYLFMATLPCDALSAFLAFSGGVVYRGYLLDVRDSRVFALQDQEWAGAFMWVFVTLAYLIPAALITMKLLSSNEADQRMPAPIDLEPLRLPDLH